MDTLTPLEEQQAALSLVLALAIGLLFGLERGWHEQQPEYAARPAGVRTFALIGLLGGVAGLLALQTTPALLGWAFAGLAATAVAGICSTRARRGRPAQRPSLPSSSRSASARSPP